LHDPHAACCTVAFSENKWKREYDLKRKKFSRILGLSLSLARTKIEAGRTLEAE